MDISENTPNGHNNEEGLRDLKNELNEVQAKVEKLQDSKKWYKNYPFILSVIAFLFTAANSLYTVYSNKKEKQETAISSAASSIRNEINDLKNAEKEYYQQMSNAYVDNNIKASLSGIYYSKINQVTFDISKKMTDKIAAMLEPTALNDYARYLASIGQIGDAIDMNLLAYNKLSPKSQTSKKDKEKYTQVTVMRSLGNLYSLPGDSQSLIKSRFYRNAALKLTKSYLGEYGIENTMSSFEIWAGDEYNNFNNKKFANSLIDSAMFYAQKLQEFNSRKYDHIRRLRLTYDYFNNKMNINFNSGSWVIWRGSKKIGTAFITNNNNAFFMDIDILKNDTLKKRLVGNGLFIGSNKMRFSLINSYLKHANVIQYKTLNQPEIINQLMFEQRQATLVLDIKENKLINAVYNEMETKPELWSLKFVRN
ncbi:transmembrane protein 258 [Mucilaginibacter agri]|uniref:Uncharacterized protein n=1 Tax=Mucilaginibacter agri TaxID=2695265 RepID=A0A966DUC0_9SPHI|nr:transmembrane protein 258 [Mucilaginibacter agri]NCD69504.1 hypothetical protein [Mucilaginibacter agri]